MSRDNRIVVRATITEDEEQVDHDLPLMLRTSAKLSTIFYEKSFITLSITISIILITALFLFIRERFFKKDDGSD